jgi:hypothetical protein
MQSTGVLSLLGHMAVYSDDFTDVCYSYDVHTDLPISCIKQSFRHVFIHSLRAEGLI